LHKNDFCKVTQQKRIAFRFVSTGNAFINKKKKTIKVLKTLMV